MTENSSHERVCMKNISSYAVIRHVDNGKEIWDKIRTMELEAETRRYSTFQ